MLGLDAGNPDRPHGDSIAGGQGDPGGPAALGIRGYGYPPRPTAGGLGVR
jgi:hypothetical protein